MKNKKKQQQQQQQTNEEQQLKTGLTYLPTYQCAPQRAK